MSKPPILIGLPLDQVAANDQTGNFPSNKYMIDNFNDNGQPALLDVFSRIPYVDVGESFRLDDGTVLDTHTTYKHLLAATLPNRDIRVTSDADRIATAWVLDICNANLGADRGEVLNWDHAYAFTNPDAFNAQVPVGVKNSVWADPDPEGVLPDRQKYWFEMSTGSRDIGYWLPDDADPTVAQMVVWLAWFTDGVALPGRNAYDIRQQPGITVQSKDNWDNAFDETWQTITQEDLDRWGWVVP